MKTTLQTLKKLGCSLSLLAVAACGEQSPANPGVGGAGSGPLGGGGSASLAGAGGGGVGGLGGAGGAAAGATTGGSGGAAPGTPTFTQVAKILSDHCGSKCHSADAPDKVNLTSDDPAALYARLTTPLDTNLCFEVPPIQKGFASISLIATVVKGPIDKPCTLPRMPFGCETSNSCLAAADIATIDGWINAGAFQN